LQNNPGVYPLPPIMTIMTIMTTQVILAKESQ